MASDKPFRVLLDLIELRIPCFKYVWISICPKEIKTITDFKISIINRINLGSENIKLFLRDGLLLDDETIMVLREDDIIRIQYAEGSLSHPNVLQCSSKIKHKRSSSEDNLQNSPTNFKRHKSSFVSINSNTTGLQENKILILDNEDNTNVSNTIANEICDESAIRKRKKKKTSQKEFSSEERTFNKTVESVNVDQDNFLKNYKKYESFKSSIEDITMYNSFQDENNSKSEINEKQKPLIFCSSEDRLTNKESPSKDQGKPECFVEELKTTDTGLPENSLVNEMEISTGSNNLDVANEPDKTVKKKRKRHRKRKSPNLLEDSNYDIEVLTCISEPSNSEVPKRVHMRYTSPLSDKDFVKVSDIEKKHIQTTQKNCSGSNTVSEEVSQVITDQSSLFPKMSTPAIENEYKNQRIAFKKNCNMLFKENLTEANSELVEQNSSESKGVKNASAESCPYSDLPILNHLPEMGTHIAYKILELGSNYCPEVSNYKEGIVKRILPDSGKVEIEFVQPEVKSVRTGKFELLKQEEAEALQNKKIIKTKDIVNWCSVIEPRLINKP